MLRHLQLIFERGFGAPAEQWSTEELQDQLEWILRLL